MVYILALNIPKITMKYDWTQKKKKKKHIVNMRYQSITSNCIRNHWKEHELGFPILKIKLKLPLHALDMIITPQI